MRNISVGYSAIALALLVSSVVPMRLAAQKLQTDPEAQKRAIEAEAAHLKTHGPQRDHDEDAAAYARIQPIARAKAQAALKAALEKPTPHTPDGHVDLNGLWISPNVAADTPSVIISADGKDRKVLFGPLPEGGTKHRDPVPAMGPNQPSYKPEFQAKVQALWFDTNHNDPTAFTCKNQGVPRMGSPDQIFQIPGQVALLYRQGTAGGTPNNIFRVIPTDGRPHRTDVDPSAEGDSVGRWEGDSLIIDVTRLSDDTWMSGSGTFHSDETHVTERITRKGNTIDYSATVEDPKVLAKPWTTTPSTKILGGPENAITNPYPCVDNDSEHLTGLIHH